MNSKSIEQTASDPSPREIAERAAEVRARRPPISHQAATNQQRRREGLRPLRDFPMVTIRMSKEDRMDLNNRAAAATMTLQAYCYAHLFPKTETELKSTAQ